MARGPRRAGLARHGDVAPSAPMTARARTLIVSASRGASRGGRAHAHAVRSRVRSARRCRRGARAGCRRRARAAIRRRRSRSTMPTKPPSIGMSTCARGRRDHAGGMSRGRPADGRGCRNRGSARGGMAPPQGLMRPARSSSSTVRPCRARSCRRRRAGRAAADDHGIESLEFGHAAHHRVTPPARRARTRAAGRGGRSRRARYIRAAVTAATKNSAASPANTTA